MTRAQERGPGEFTVKVTEKTELYSLYMPYLKQGGLFVATRQPLDLHEKVMLHLELFDDATQILINGTVVWVTPPNPAGRRQQGVGVQFPDDEVGQALRRRIEGLLAGASIPSHSTHTL